MTKMQDIKSIKKVSLTLTEEEIRFLNSLLVLVKWKGLIGLHPEWYPVVEKLSDKLVVSDIQSFIKELEAN